MRKGKNVIGQSVLSYADGVRIHSVKDLLISDNNDAIIALLVDEGGLLGSSQVIPIENVRTFGKDAVIVETSDRVVSAANDPDVNAILHRQDKLLGKKVVTDMGQAMGAISDMYFDEFSGRISGFEVSTGLFGDMASGTSFLPVNDIDRLGPDVVFVRPETGEALDAQVGGVRGAFQDAGDKLSGAVTDATSNAQQGVADQQPEQRLIGRTSGRDVADDNGNIIVASGERIRPEHVEWAKQTDNMGSLTAAVAAGAASDAKRKAGQGVEQAADSIGSMWDRFVLKLGETRDEQGRQADAAQTAQRLATIQDAIGRPMQKAILDRNDDLILDFGDIVTHKSIQLAHEAGMLDTLLANVHRATVSFPNDQLRARQPAQATIDKASGGATVVDELEQKVEQHEREEAQKQEQSRQQTQQQVEQREREREQRAQQRDQADQPQGSDQAQGANQPQGAEGVMVTSEQYSGATHYSQESSSSDGDMASGMRREAGESPS